MLLPLALVLGAGTAGAQFGSDTEREQRSGPENVSPDRPVSGADGPDDGGQDRAARNSAPVTSARNVASAQDHQQVKLRGKIVSQQGRNQYVLADGTGSVVIEADSRTLNGRKLAAGTEVEVRGTVSKRASKSPRVDAQSVMVLAAGTSSPSSPLNDQARPDERG